MTSITEKPTDPNSPGLDHLGLDRPGLYCADLDCPGLDRASLDRPGFDRAGLYRADLDCPGLDRSAEEISALVFLSFFFFKAVKETSVSE